MDREQARTQNKIRQLVAKSAKEKSWEQFKLLLPVVLEWVELASDDRSHSRWFWEDLEKRFEKDYEKTRYSISQVTTSVNEVSAERPSSPESKEEIKTDIESKDSTAKTEQVHTTRKTRSSKKDVRRGI